MVNTMSSNDYFVKKMTLLSSQMNEDLMNYHFLIITF